MTARPPAAPAWWFGDGIPPWHARALEPVYGTAIALRSALYRHRLLRARKAAAPVVVVGNLIAGGSGKTPLVVALVERLADAGWAPGVASRGYGRGAAATARWVDCDTDAATGGDEPVMIARRTRRPVRVDRDRVAAAGALVDAGCDIVVSDDGLQHTRLARDVEIEVIDGRRRYGNGRLLPAGPLREPASRGTHCDFRVLNTGSGTEAETRFGEWPMRLAPGDAVPLGGARRVPLSSFAGQRVHAVAGIGDPERFFTMLRALGIAVVPHAFPDHHRFSGDDLLFGSDLPVLMTEKDAVKCRGLAVERSFFVPVRAELPEAFWVAVLDRLAALRGVA